MSAFLHGALVGAVVGAMVGVLSTCLFVLAARRYGWTFADGPEGDDA